MDGYISKPVNFAEVRETLERVSEQGKSTAAPVTEARPATDVWDPEAALARVDGDRALFRDVIEIFRQEGPKLEQKLEAALAEGDQEGVQRAAHSIKGEVSYFAAPKAFEAAKAIEYAARDGDLAKCQATLPELKRRLEELAAALQEMQQEVSG
jgi:HPt (histidine-containing phosphotransfer) domain-containing protein